MAAIMVRNGGGLTVAGPTMAATIGPGGPFMAREIAIAGPPGPTVGGTS